MDDVMQLVESLPHPPALLKEKKWLTDLRTRTVQVICYTGNSTTLFNPPLACFKQFFSNALIH